MAATKIRSVKGDASRTIEYVADKEKTKQHSGDSYQSLKDVLVYTAQKDKTLDDVYITGINCSERNVYATFVKTKRQWGKTNGIQCYHAMQSFKPGESNARTVHEIGLKLAEIMWGDRFEILVTTHVDKEHLHNHFVVNSVSFVDGGKYHLGNGEKRWIRHLSDLLCEEYDLSVIDPGHKTNERKRLKGLGLATPSTRGGRPSFRKEIRKEINQLVREVSSIEDLYQRLMDKGYAIKENVEHVAIKAPGMQRYARLRSLGDAFTPEALMNRIARQKPNRYYVQNDKTGWLKRRLFKQPWYTRQFRSLYRLLLKQVSWREEMIQKYGTPKVKFEAVKAIEDYSAKIRIICKYQFTTVEQVEAFIREGLGTEHERRLLSDITSMEKKKMEGTGGTRRHGEHSV